MLTILQAFLCMVPTESRITPARGDEYRNWQRRIIAVDKNGLEHINSSATGSGSSEDVPEVWTITFSMTLAGVKDIRAQIRPIHWVEFRNVALMPLCVGKSTKVPQSFGPIAERTFTQLLDFDTGKTGEFPKSDGHENPIAGIAKTMAWMQEDGFDVLVGLEKLEMLGVRVVDFV